MDIRTLTAFSSIEINAFHRAAPLPPEAVQAGPISTSGTSCAEK
jgi:hypothetical protein